MTDRVQELASAFRRAASARFAAYPALSHVWKDEGAVVTLTFPRADPSGFEVALQVGDGYAYVLVGHSHYSFNLQAGLPEPEIQRALDLVCQLLSPKMRLREYASNGKPYRWIVERQVDGDWQLELEEFLILFDYFREQKESVYQNNQLPAR